MAELYEQLSENAKLTLGVADVDIIGLDPDAVSGTLFLKRGCYDY